MDLESQLASRILFESGLLEEVIECGGRAVDVRDSFFKIFSTVCVFLVYYYCDGDGANVRRKSPSVC